MNQASSRPSPSRIIQVLFRSLHIAAMGLVLGGLALGGDYQRLRTAIFTTVGSGLVLVAVDLFKGPDFLVQGSGVALLIKLALLGMGLVFPGARLEWYLAATVVASIGSHMPAAWRHYNLLPRRFGRHRGQR